MGHTFHDCYRSYGRDRYFDRNFEIFQWIILSLVSYQILIEKMVKTSMNKNPYRLDGLKLKNEK